MSRPCRIGTRGSPLALAQAEAVGALIEDRLGWEWELRTVSSKGDLQLHLPLHQAQEPGLFTRSLEQALQANEVDLAVHSLKDLPLAQPPNLPVVAIPRRETVGDLLLVREDHHDPEVGEEGKGLPLIPGTRVGTSAPRRQAYLLAHAPEVVPIDLRGNVGTRLRKLDQGWMEAQIMAAAPFQRMKLELPEGMVSVPLKASLWPSAPGQGALAIQTRSDWIGAEELGQLDHGPTRVAVTAEREVLATLGGGCGLPLGVHMMEGTDGEWSLTAQMAGENWRAQQRPSLARFQGRGKDPKALVEAAAGTLRRELAHIASGADNATQVSVKSTQVQQVHLPDDTRWLVAGTASTASRFSGQLTVSGIAARAWPLIETRELIGPEDDLPRGLIDAWVEARWVLVASARTVPTLSRLEREHPRTDLQWGGVGPATARGLRAANLPLHLLAPGGTGLSLAQELVRLKGFQASPVFMPGAREPSSEGPAALEAAGLEVTQWPIYRTGALEVTATPDCATLAGVIVLSPSAVEVLAGIPVPGNLRFLALGPSTARALEQKGLPCHGVATQRDHHSIIKLVRSL